MHTPFYIMGTLAYFAIAAFITIVSMAVSSRDKTMQMQETRKLQEDAQEFNSEEAEKGRDWQEEFWKENQSPAALMQQYRDLGASDSAAIMAALGQSGGSVPSPAVGSSSQSSLPFMGNTFSELFDSFQSKVNDFYSNEKIKADTEKTKTETGWIPTINQFTIDKGIQELENMKSRLKLDNDIYKNVTLPVANSTIDLNAVEIDKKIQETENLEQEWNNLVQEFYRIRSQTRLNESSANLNDEKAYTETFVRANLGSQTNFNNANAVGVNLENRIKILSTETSEKLGFDVRLPASTNILTMGVSDTGALIQVLDDQGNWINKKVSDVFKGASSALKAVRSSLKFQSLTQKAIENVDLFYGRHLPKYSPAYNQYMRGRGEYLKGLEDFINNNTRYGYNKGYSKPKKRDNRKSVWDYDYFGN